MDPVRFSIARSRSRSRMGGIGRIGRLRLGLEGGKFLSILSTYLNHSSHTYIPACHTLFIVIVIVTRKSKEFLAYAFFVLLSSYRPVGSGKTALMLALCRALRDEYSIAAVTNDIFTRCVLSSVNLSIDRLIFFLY